MISIEVMRTILVHLELKAWPVTSDFEFLFPVCRLHVPTPPQYLNPASNSETGGRGLEGEGTGGRRFCIAFCRENGFTAGSGVTPRS